MLALATFWHAEISMLMPASHAERNALVEFLQTGSSRRCVHGADQFVSVLGFLIEQRRGAGGLEVQAFQGSVPVFRAVIHCPPNGPLHDVSPIRHSLALHPTF